MSLVSPKVYIGDVYQASDLSWLKSAGITHIVNMAVELPTYFPKKFYYYRANAEDNESQSLEDILREGYRFMIHGEHHGGNILVHCYAGISRSSSMVLYYLMRKFRISLVRAFQHLKTLHPRTRPNPGFWRQLKELEPRKSSLSSKSSSNFKSFKQGF